MLTNKTRLPLLAQFADLFLIEITNWRWSWRSLVVLGTVAPLMSILALSLFADKSNPETLSYILTGNIVMALMFGIKDKLQSHFMFMRIQGSLDYFATLPVNKMLLVAAATAAFLCLGLPSVVVTLFFGAWLLRIPLSISPWVLPVAVAAAISLSGVGALVGIWARTPEDAGSISTLLTFLMLGIGPVLIPPEGLPPLLVILGRFSPATYASSALRQVLLGPLTPRLWVDVAALLGFSLITFVMVNRQLAWRRE
ncbi:MAG: ABC transporter permease [Anaerolineales bacterium]|nr:ABC transporter permease [Anaerolineales bacterium]MCB8952982.1 ABC transporter permease [Ardenticatenales bacterium]